MTAQSRKKTEINTRWHGCTNVRESYAENAEGSEHQGLLPLGSGSFLAFQQRYKPSWTGGMWRRLLPRALPFLPTPRQGRKMNGEKVRLIQGAATSCPAQQHVLLGLYLVFQSQLLIKFHP